MKDALVFPLYAQKLSGQNIICYVYDFTSYGVAQKTFAYHVLYSFDYLLLTDYYFMLVLRRGVCTLYIIKQRSFKCEMDCHNTLCTP